MLTATLLPPTHARPLVALSYDPSILSDGLTVDTLLGPVDLVAIERARCGRLLKLTRAESVYLDEMTGTKPAGSGEWS